MIEPVVGRQYWFVRPRFGGSGDGSLEVTHFIRHHDDSAGAVYDGHYHIYENAPGVWRKALTELYSVGFLEEDEARAKGVAPPDWEVPEETRAQHPWVEPREKYRLAYEHNLACRRYANKGPLCPHCGNRENIRFVDYIPQMEELREQGFMYLGLSYFVCPNCARSHRMEYVRPSAL